MDSDEEGALVARISALYERARSSALLDPDRAAIGSTEFRDCTTSIESIFGSRDELERAIPGFLPTYDVFRIFDAGSVVLDVGAHWGYSAVAMRQNGCRAKVISIEAMPANLSALRRLKELAEGSYDFINVAASDTSGVLQFYIPTINGQAITGLATTGGTLTDFFAKYLANLAMRLQPEGPIDISLALVEVPAMPIDLLLAQTLPATALISAIKMDVEGHEPAALRGANRTLGKHRPLLMIEGGNRNPKVVGEMTGLGYFHCERREGKLVPHPEKTAGVDGFWVHPERVAEYRSLNLMD